MDNFAIDLDKVLDDFEENEDQTVPGHRRPPPTYEDLCNGDYAHFLQTTPTANHSPPGPLATSGVAQPTPKWDLTEADFGPSLPRTKLKIHHTNDVTTGHNDVSTRHNDVGNHSGPVSDDVSSLPNAAQRLKTMGVSNGQSYVSFSEAEPTSMESERVTSATSNDVGTVTSHGYSMTLQGDVPASCGMTEDVTSVGTENAQTLTSSMTSKTENVDQNHVTSSCVMSRGDADREPSEDTEMTEATCSHEIPSMPDSTSQIAAESDAESTSGCRTCKVDAGGDFVPNSETGTSESDMMLEMEPVDSSESSRVETTQPVVFDRLGFDDVDIDEMEAYIGAVEAKSPAESDSDAPTSNSIPAVCVDTDRTDVTSQEMTCLSPAVTSQTSPEGVSSPSDLSLSPVLAPTAGLSIPCRSDDEERSAGGSSVSSSDIPSFLLAAGLGRAAINTPRDDLGRSRIPCRPGSRSSQAGLASGQSDADSPDQSAIRLTDHVETRTSEPSGSGARPKEGKIPRPNSLLGLSTPVLPSKWKSPDQETVSPRGRPQSFPACVAPSPQGKQKRPTSLNLPISRDYGGDWTSGKKRAFTAPGDEASPVVPSARDEVGTTEEVDSSPSGFEVGSSVLPGYEVASTGYEVGSTVEEVSPASNEAGPVIPGGEDEGMKGVGEEMTEEEEEEIKQALAASLESSSLLPESSSHSPDALCEGAEGHSVAGAFGDAEDVEGGLGHVAPVWVPDQEAMNCMQCDVKFTFTRRRHHCRACGKVFCSNCCNSKAKLGFLDHKEARVCLLCHISLARKYFGHFGTVDSESESQSSRLNRAPDPNVPSEYCFTISPLQQANPHAPPPSVMVPVGVLKKGNPRKEREPKSVMFSDGIRPGGDLTELDGPADVGLPAARKTSRTTKKVERENMPEGADFVLDETPDLSKIMTQLIDESAPPIVFAINKNLLVLVKIVNLNCCVCRTCWCFTTRGMGTVGQEEIVIVLECLQMEKTVPRDVFYHLNTVYEEAGKGNPVSDLGHTIFAQPFLGSKDHSGFLYVRPSFQCLNKLVLPEPPYVFGILLQRWETPWAKIFPIRLMLRLGSEYRYYPCPLISVRFRGSVFGEIGHTIMNLLADFRNYQYMLAQIRGFTVHLQDKRTTLALPRNRYKEVMRIVNNSNDHVMALGASFSMEADSHLVCIQNDDGSYQTQAINIQNKPRKVTGASFVVFNGALKASSGMTAKSSIVEDGLMIQITPDMMAALKASLREMREHTIQCGPASQSEPDETVTLQWVDDDKNFNVGVKSPIDGQSMEGVVSMYVNRTTDFMGETLGIRMTQVFFLAEDGADSPQGDPVDPGRLAESLGQATCIALTQHLDSLKRDKMTKIALRVTIQSDKVGYEVGSLAQKLPVKYMNELDNELIPVIHNAASSHRDGPITLELVFYIIE